MAFSACSKKPDPPPQAQKEDVEVLFRKMVNKRSLSGKDPIFQKIIGMGPAIAPDLHRIAKNNDIQWHYIAYVMLCKMKDRDSIPFLFEALASKDPTIQKHAVWGLDCLLRLGRYNDGDPDVEEVKSRYRQWWEKHKGEFPASSGKR